jgi:predicted permease
MDTLRQDLAYALRTLGKSPAFTAVVVLTLALGIGANTAIFTIMDQVLLRQLPVWRPQELVQLDGPGPFMGMTMNERTFSYPMYLDLRDRGDVFTGTLGRFPSSATLTYRGQAEPVDVDVVTGNYFDVLGVRAALGRTLTPDDDRNKGGHPVVMLGHGFWIRRFGADASILNQQVLLNGQGMTVVGVTPAGFHGLEVGRSPDVLVPMAMKPQITPTWDEMENRRARWLNVFARLQPGVSREQAETALNVAYRQILEQELHVMPAAASQNFRQRFLAKRLVLLPGLRGQSELRDQVSTPLVVLMGMVGLILLIACANVANLLIARAAARQKEIAIRLALGAGRRRIVRQLVVESLTLAAWGGALGLLLAVWMSEGLLRALPLEDVAKSLSASPDRRVALFTLAVSLLTGLVFGLAPALQATRPNLLGTLKDEAGAVLSGGPPQVRFRKGLVVAQVALSLLLLVGAGLFARSLHNLRRLDPGFQIAQILTFGVDPSLSGYSPERALVLVDQIRQRLTGLPGVQSVSLAETPPMTGNATRSTMKVDGYTPQEGEDMNSHTNAVGPRYFSSMGIPLLSGREFDERDAKGAGKVALVNETMARRFFPPGQAVGRRLGFGRYNVTDMEIVGVVKDGKFANLRDEAPRFVYVPYAQQGRMAGVTFYVRAAGEPATLFAAVRQAVRDMDAGLPVVELKTMRAQVDESLFVDRTVAILSAAFGLLATLLAAVGLYGVMSYTVARRTREIGIRMALGAERRAILRLVLREVGTMAALGIGVGLPLAVGLSRLLRSQLFGLSPADPLTLATATLALGTVALLAGLFPAQRATRVDPLVALRYE